MNAWPLTMKLNIALANFKLAALLFLQRGRFHLRVDLSKRPRQNVLDQSTKPVQLSLDALYKVLAIPFMVIAIPHYLQMQMSGEPIWLIVCLLLMALYHML